MDQPRTQYVRSGEFHIAYQVFGKAPIDLLCVFGLASNLEAAWDHPLLARWYRRLGSFARLILLDRRGTGMSDPLPHGVEPRLEDAADDIRAVLDALQVERAAVFAEGGAGPQGIQFASMHPEYVSSLVLYGTYSRLARAPDYPAGVDRQAFERYVEWATSHWGTGDVLRAFAPSKSGDDQALRQWGRIDRLGMSPGLIAASLEAAYKTDVRERLPLISARTLVIHRSGDPMFPIEHGRFLAANIAGSQFKVLEGSDHAMFTGDWEALAAEIEEFLTGTRNGHSMHRSLATLLFTDFVDSTRKTAEVGDRRWRELMDEHDAIAQRQIERFEGRLVKATGDGIVATFQGAAQAIHAALSIRDGIRALGLDVRTGLHTGEIELRGRDVSGLGVSIAARVMHQAGAGEVLVSRTVTDVVAGSGIVFVDRGEHELKGVPGRWQLFAVEA